MSVSLSDESLEEVIKGMSSDDLFKFVRHIREIERSQEANPLIHFVPTCSQEVFLKSDKKEEFFFGANSSGKSVAGAYKTACYLTGSDPNGLIPHPIPAPVRRVAGLKVFTKLWMGCVKLEKGVDIIKQNLLPLLPRDSYFPLNETKGILQMKEGPTLQCMSYDADTEKWQSDALDGAWLDEQSPWDKYRELRARVARRDGRIWCTMTPIYAHSAWTYWEIYKKAQSGENPDIGYCFADLEDNIYLTEVMKQRLYSAYKGTEEEAARLHGKFILLKDVIHPSFDPATHIIEPFEIVDYHRQNYSFVRIFDLHPRQNSVMTLAMYKERPQQIFVIRELSMPGGIVNMSEFKRAVNEITRALKIKIEIDIIDTPDPSATNPGPGMQEKRIPVTLLSALAIDEEHRGEWIQGIAGIPANRDLTTGIKRFNDLLREEGFFFVFSNCKNHIHSIENYRWDDWKGVSAYEKPPKEQPIKKR